MKVVSVADLPALTADVAVPFELDLRAPAGDARWTIREVLRVLPGRRLVVRAVRRGDGGNPGDVVIKLFYGPRHRRYCRREQEGLAHMRRAGLPVPQQRALVDGLGVSAIVLAYLPEAAAVADSNGPAVETVAEHFGRLHRAGYRQTDPHLGNFVVSGGVVYAVDGDGVRQRSGLSGRQGDLNNLARLAAQRSPARDDELPGLLTAYGRGHGGQPPRLEQLREQLTHARRARVRRYLAKTRRDCTEFAVARSAGRTTYAVRGVGEAVSRCLVGGRLDPAAVDFLPGEVLKQGNSATLVRTAGDVPVVVKRYNVKSASHGMRRMLRWHPRYRRAWMFGQVLSLLGIPTARPLALVEERNLFWRGVAYLAQQSLTGPDLGTEVATDGLSDARCAEVVGLFRMLHSAGLCHGDTKASNFVLHEDRLHLIDLDAMRQSPRGFETDVARFLDNWTEPLRRRFEAAFREAGLI